MYRNMGAGSPQAGQSVYSCSPLGRGQSRGCGPGSVSRLLVCSPPISLGPFPLEPLVLGPLFEASVCVTRRCPHPYIGISRASLAGRILEGCPLRSCTSLMQAFACIAGGCIAAACVHSAFIAFGALSCRRLETLQALQPPSRPNNRPTRGATTRNPRPSATGPRKRGGSTQRPPR